MTVIEIDTNTARAAEVERKSIRQVLEWIVLAEQERVPQELGYKNTYDWLITRHKYSGGAANRRIQAARLLKDVPEVAIKIETGALTLTTMWQAQKFMRGQKAATKRQVLQKLENKTSEQVERELHSIFPDMVKIEEKTVYRQDGRLRIIVEFTKEEAEEFEKARSQLSHTTFTYGQTIARLAKAFNATTTPRRNMIRRLGGRCSYKDARTGKVCGSRYQLEIDHILPKALGGTSDASNLRCLCRKHNQLMAERAFGRSHMELFQR